MPRRTYNPRKGRARRQAPGESGRWQELLREVQWAGGTPATGTQGTRETSAVFLSLSENQKPPRGGWSR